MKRHMTVLAALLIIYIGFSSGLLGTAASAGQRESVSQTNPLPDTDTAAAKAVTPSDTKAPGLASLEIPQKMEVIIDPWEIDGRTQIYSEPYTIRNNGKTAGTLILTFTCTSGENAGVVVREDSEDLHNDKNEEKSLYIKLISGDGEEIIFSEEGAEYQVELKPGEEMTLRFEGEVSENASEPWKDGDVKIDGVYSWETEDEILEDTSNKEVWDATDISKVKIAYTIQGLPQSDYEYAENAGEITYGLYKEDTEAPSIGTKSYAMTANTAIDITVDLGKGSLAATGVSKVMDPTGAWDYLTGENQASYDAASKKITLSAGMVDACISANVSHINVIFNDAAATTVKIDLTK